MKKQILFLSAVILLSTPILFIGCKKSSKDTTKPVITLNGYSTSYWEFNKTYSDLGATANDDLDGTVAVTTSGTVNPAVIGTYVINYSASDAAGNTATASRTVFVVLFDGIYNVVQTSCLDTSRNTVPTHPDSSVVNASSPLEPGFYDMTSTNFARRSLSTLTNIVFSGNTITVPLQADPTGTTGDQVKATGTISGSGVGANKLKFTFQFQEINVNDSLFNKGTAVFTHR